MLGKLEAETSISAAERFFAAEVDGSKISNVSEALDVTVRWLNKVGESATDKNGMINMLTRARVRTWFNSSLKEYIDRKEPESNSESVTRVNQWLAMRGDDKPVFVKRETRKGVQGFQGVGKMRRINCYLCGKVGHMARDCRVGREDAPKTAEMGDRKSNKPPRSEPKPTSFFVCGKEGHKANTCPDRRDKAA